MIRSEAVTLPIVTSMVSVPFKGIGGVGRGRYDGGVKFSSDANDPATS